jgi:hypothetical protein
MTKSNLPAWLVTEIALRTTGIITRSETVEQLHARILREKGERWDNATQSWVKA